MTIYCISGLGADYKAFDRIEWDAKHHIVHIPWLEPYDKENLQQYARRMASAINTQEPFALVGLSFGGIVAIEMLAFLNPNKIVLISSISHSAQLPWYFRLIGKTNLYKTHLFLSLKNNTHIINALFGQKETPLGKYLKNRFAHISDRYLSWSMEQILRWQQNEKPNEVFQIHGTKDIVFPISRIKADYVIDGGSHFMIYTHAKQVSKHLQQILSYQL